LTMSDDAPKKTEARRIEKQVEIAAPVEAVWKMLTDPAGLARWFPLEARVKPGAGGEIVLSWGPAWEATGAISVWEPNKRLQTVDSSMGQPMTFDWTLEAREGKTIVRFVQSGFATGADWENEFWDSTNYGWAFMLANLRHCMERHAGQERLVAWPRVKSELSREEIYKRMAAPGGLFEEGVAGGEFLAGRSYALRAANGEKWTGRVEFIFPPRGFCVTVEALNDALCWLTIEGAEGNYEPQLWFSTYGLAKAEVAAIEETWSNQLKRILT
jgi:uncharacterized protein YndB with AHSA1/START domain